MDHERMIVGHLAFNRLGSRSLPVSVLVKDDPRTQGLFAYYSSTIASLGTSRAGSGKAGTNAPAQGDQ